MRPMRIVECPDCGHLTRPPNDDRVLCQSCGADFRNPHNDPYEPTRPRLRCILGVHAWALVKSNSFGTIWRCEWCGAERLQA